METVRNRLGDIVKLLPFQPINVSSGIINEFNMISPSLEFIDASHTQIKPTLELSDVSHNIQAWNTYYNEKMMRLIALKSNYNEAYNYMTKNNNLQPVEKNVFESVQQKIKMAGLDIENQYNYFEKYMYFTSKDSN